MQKFAEARHVPFLSRKAAPVLGLAVAAAAATAAAALQGGAAGTCCESLAVIAVAVWLAHALMAYVW